MKSLAFMAALAIAAPATAQKFAAFGDFGNRVGSVGVAALNARENPDYILGLGDQCYESFPFATQLEKYAAWTKTNRFWPALGNHEFSDSCGGGAARAYLAYFNLPNNERYYDVVIGNAHVFVVNSEGTVEGNLREPDGSGPTSKQAMYIKAKMLASTSPWKIVTMHRPPFSSGEHGNMPRMQWPFEQWGADAVLAGHDHNYERVMQDADRNGRQLPYFVSGLGGAEQRAFGTIRPGSVVRYNAGHGALFFTATPTTLDFQFKNTAGVVIDSLKLTKAGAPPPPPPPPPPETQTCPDGSVIPVSDVCPVLPPPPPPPPPVAIGEQAMPAYALYDSMGVVIQPAFASEAAWNNDIWPKHLEELGLCNVRGKLSTNTTAVRRLGAFFARGCKIVTNPVDQNPTIDEANTKRNIAFIAANVPARNIAGIESANEYNHGRTITEAATALKALQPKLKMWVQAHPALASTPLLSPSPYVRDPAFIKALGNLEPNVDYWNLHYYNEGRRPGLTGGLTVPGTLTQAMKDASIMAPTKPGMTTEWGYKYATFDAAPAAGVLSDLAASKYINREWFDLFAAGSVKNYLYSLIDDEHRGAINHGLMDQNFRKRGSFYAVKNLAVLFRDLPTTTAGKLDYSVSGGNASLRRYLFQKSDGSFLLVMYQDVDSWNRSTKRDINVPAVLVTVTLGSGAAMQVYHPTLQAAPVQAANDNRIVVPVADHVTVLHIQPVALGERG